MQGTRITSIKIVGGGDVGLFNALSLNRLLGDTVDIAVVDDFDTDPDPVGKSTFAAIQSFLFNHLDFSRDEFKRDVQPVWKMSVSFPNWNDASEFIYPFDQSSRYPTDDAFHEGLYYYHHQPSTRGQLLTEHRKTPFRLKSDENLQKYDSHAYHFEVNRLNRFLRQKCRERGVQLINDNVQEVDTDGNYIESITGTRDTYTADLYLDATGFNRVLFDRLDDPTFEEFPVPLDSALHTTTPIELEEVCPSTVVTRGECGWFWQIDTTAVRDYGYVFSSEHATVAEATEEFEAHIPESDIAELDTYEFDSGHYTEPWTGNCIAVGNAAGFVEPIQSTSLTTHAIIARRLSKRLHATGGRRSGTLVDMYNSLVSGLWTTTYDFIALHYNIATQDTQFWRDISGPELTDRTERYLELYDQTGLAPRGTEHLRADGYKLDSTPFTFLDTLMFLVGLGYESSFYEEVDIDVRPEVKERMQRQTADLEQAVRQQYLSYPQIYGNVNRERAGLERGASRSPLQE